MNFNENQDNLLKNIIIKKSNNNRKEINYKKLSNLNNKLNIKKPKTFNKDNNNILIHPNLIYKSVLKSVKENNNTNNLNSVNYINKINNIDNKNFGENNYMNYNIKKSGKEIQNIKVNKAKFVNKSNVNNNSNNLSNTYHKTSKTNNILNLKNNISPMNSEMRKELLFHQDSNIDYNSYNSSLFNDYINNHSYTKKHLSNNEIINYKNKNKKENLNINNTNNIIINKSKIDSNQKSLKRAIEDGNLDTFDKNTYNTFFGNENNFTYDNSFKTNVNYNSFIKNNKNKNSKYKLFNSEVKKIINLKTNSNIEPIKSKISNSTLNSNLYLIKNFNPALIDNNSLNYSNRILSKKKKIINISSEHKNIYNNLSNRKKNSFKENDKLYAFSEEQKAFTKLGIEKYTNYQKSQQNKDDIKINKIDIENNLANSVINEDIKKLQKELNHKNLIIKSFLKIINESKRMISQLTEKNNKLKDNSNNLSKQNEKLKNELLYLKNENSTLINNYINYNYNDNEGYINQINNLKKELKKYKIENKGLKKYIIKYTNNKNNKINKINKNNDINENNNLQDYIFKNCCDNIYLENPNDRKCHSTSKKKKTKKVLYINKNFKEDDNYD